MSLQQQIEQALKDAMREKNEDKRNAIRSLLTAIKNKEKELKRSPAEAEIQQLIATQIKQRRESLEHYSQAGRKDLACSEENEITALQAFLPAALTPDQLDSLVTGVIKEVDARSPKDMGKVMKALMPRVAGRADGRQVNEVVKEKLQSLG
ncbi:GatB/YqeY domain-containing protein [Desulfoferrobacter suflitae]|uniref:GatB/YqeY domain-containing protein n=1 Tax=Desulfoferrobacter suflitae TaxID=2865782 RepID=UPI00216484C7|nr:GatB/YqeY domain-containing protein [Desulfoferrobacter suflitae]MCK8601394.1 GatB/YqeY domain-containing protein [Desulfoferrobacter suflitae]